jgi:hypothetical protein
LARLARTCKSNPVALCRVGKPAAEILDYARAASADLIVAGSHGHGAIANMILGSVAGRLVRQAPCPVLTVPSSQAGDLATIESIQAEPAMATAEPPGGVTGSRSVKRLQ